VTIAENQPAKSSAIQRHAGSAPWEATYGYCRVVVAGGWAMTAGTTATGPGGVRCPGDAYGQTRAAFEIALTALSQVGAGRENVVRTRMYVTDVGHQADVGRAHQEIFGAAPPVATMVQVSALADPAHLVEVEVESFLGAPPSPR
jgi:enamine deaminase RidA (YjgF/YER057c/UK114 family)